MAPCLPLVLTARGRYARATDPRQGRDRPAGRLRDAQWPATRPPAPWHPDGLLLAMACHKSLHAAPCTATASPTCQGPFADWTRQAPAVSAFWAARAALCRGRDAPPGRRRSVYISGQTRGNEWGRSNGSGALPCIAAACSLRRTGRGAAEVALGLASCPCGNAARSPGEAGLAAASTRRCSGRTPAPSRCR